jgi:diacylglycerol kinase (ATP)
MLTPGKLLVLANPAAGRGRAGRVEAVLKAYWSTQGVEAQFLSPGSLSELRERVCQAPQQGYSTVVALGGDGTFHEILNAAQGLEILLGLIPAGGGNDIARALGIPLDPLEAARRLLRARIRRMDAVRLSAADGRVSLFAGAGGAGLDAEAARLANTRFRRVPGVARYVAAAVAAFREIRPMHVTIEADGTVETVTALLVAVANSPSYGNGVRIAPAASPFDGWMDVAIIAPLRWSQLLDGLLLALRSGDIRWPEMRRLRARRMRLSADRPVIFHGDGEVLGETPVELEILPGALRVLA